MERTILALSLLFLCRYCQGQRAIVSISPVTEFTPGTSALTVTCSPSGSGVKQYEGITLYHNDSQSTMTEKQVATVFYSIATTSNDASLSSTYNRQGVQATGAVTPLGSAQLQVTFDATSTLCGDAGTYRCEVKGKDTNNADITWGGMASISAKVIPTVPPTLTIQSNSFPSFPDVTTDTRYAVGTVLTLTCSGQIGGDPKIEHRWCWQQLGSDMNPSLTGYPFGSHINQGTPTKSGCQYSRTSTLTYNITAADTNTMFICEDGAANTLMCGSGTFSANVTIRNNVVTDTQPQTNDDGTPSNAGAIAGGVIGGLAGLILIILIVYFFVFRGRNAGESYQTKEDGTPEGPVATEGPVYSVPSQKGRGDRHGRRGHENPGMDENHQNNYPRKHRHEGRGKANPNYENDSHSDRYSDRDGDVRGSRQSGMDDPGMAHPGLGSAV